MKNPRATRQETVYSCPFFEVKKDHLVFENGASWDYNYLSTLDGICVVALNDSHEVYLLKEYRYPLRTTLLGLPSGGIEGHDSPLAAAQAELQEEAGLQASEWTFMGNFYPSPGSASHTAHMYLARDLKVADRMIEAYEQIEVVTMPFEKAVEYVYAGKILDAWAVIPILKVKEFLNSH